MAEQQGTEADDWPASELVMVYNLKPRSGWTKAVAENRSWLMKVLPAAIRKSRRVFGTDVHVMLRVHVHGIYDPLYANKEVGKDVEATVEALISGVQRDWVSYPFFTNQERTCSDWDSWLRYVFFSDLKVRAIKARLQLVLPPSEFPKEAEVKDK